MPKPEGNGLLLFVYALGEPDGKTVRYIGVTGNLWKRLREHYTSPNAPALKTWIHSLRVKGLVPSMTVLREIRGIEAAIAAEAEEIKKHFAAVGDSLLNDTHTGRYRGVPSGHGLLSFGGETMSAKQWAERLGITRQALSLRLQRYTPDIALSRAKDQGKQIAGERRVVRLPQSAEDVSAAIVQRKSNYHAMLTHEERRLRRMQIAELVDSGRGVADVAKEFGITVTTVYNAVREFTKQAKAS